MTIKYREELMAKQILVYKNEINNGCPRCGSEKAKSWHNFCGNCGYQLKDKPFILTK
jgi:hypothetical protein